MDKKNSRVKIVKIEVHYGRCQSTAWTESNYNTSACANFLTIDEDYPVVTNPTIPKQNPYVVLIKAFVQSRH